MKKLLVLLLALGLMLTGTAFAELPIGTVLTPSPEDYAYTDLSEHKTVYMYLVGDGESTYPDFPEILELINGKLAAYNTTLEITVISWSDADNMYPLILTGGEKADLIFTATWRNLWTGAADESFYAVDMEFIEKYMPYSFQYMPESAWPQVTYGGKIQAFPQNLANPSPQLLGLRLDLAEEYGLPTEIYTWEDLKTYMLGVAEHTGETGIFAYNAGSTDSLTGNSMTRVWDTFQVSRTGNVYFVAGDGTVPAPEDLFFYYTSDQYRWVVEEAHALLEAGCWSRSALSKTENAAQSFQNGTGAVISWNYTIYQYMTYLEEQVLGVEKGAATFDAMLYPEEYGVDCEAYNNNAISILAGSEDPYRAAMVLDLLKFDTEINTWICKGVEGRHFILGDDWSTEHGPEFEDYTMSGMSWCWAVQNGNFKDVFNRPDYTEMFDFCKEHKLPNPTVSFVFDVEPVSAYNAAITATADEYRYTLGLGLVDDVDAALAEFIDALTNSGMETFMEEYIAQYTEWYNAQ